MITLKVRGGHEQEDIEEGQAILIAEIDRPETKLMIIRGSSPEKAQFAELARGRADEFNNRELVWVTDTSILNHPRFAGFFNKEEDAAVVLDLQNRVKTRLPVTANIREIDNAFL